MSNKVITKSRQIRTFALPLHFVENKQFYNDLRHTLKISRIVYNRTLTHCIENDKEAFIKYGNNENFDKIPKIENTSIYKIESGLFPCSTKTQCAAITRTAETKYRQKRLDIIKGVVSLPIQRSVPFPILRNDNKTQIWFEIDEFGYEHLYIQLKLFNEQICNTYKCELKSGSNFSKQINTLKKLWTNPNYDKNINGSKKYLDPEDTIQDIGDSRVRINNKGKVIFELSVKIPKTEEKTKNGTLKIFSTKDSLLSCIIDKSSIPFSFNCDHIIRWQSERDRKQQRLRQDNKFDRKIKKYIYKKQKQISRKYSNRMKNACHKISSLIIKKALTLNVAKIELDTTIKSYLKSFTWFDLEQKIEYKAKDNNIEFEKITRQIIEPELTDPHIYFQLAIDVDTNKSLNKIKIGQTGSGKKRKKDLENMGGQKLIYLCGDKQTKSNLIKKEKEYHALFNSCKLSIGKEWFEAGPILEWIKEMGVLGNMGNINEISQYVDYDNSRGPVVHETPLALVNDGSI